MTKKNANFISQTREYNTARQNTQKAIRILTGSKYNAHTEPLFKQLNLLKISDICKLQEIIFYYKLINNKLPLYFNTFNCQRNSEIHTNNTRQRHALHITRTNHTFAQINLKLSAQPYGQPNAKYVHFCTCTRYLMCT